MCRHTLLHAAVARLKRCALLSPWRCCAQNAPETTPLQNPPQHMMRSQHGVHSLQFLCHVSNPYPLLAAQSSAAAAGSCLCSTHGQRGSGLGLLVTTGWLHQAIWAAPLRDNSENARSEGPPLQPCMHGPHTDKQCTSSETMHLGSIPARQLQARGSSIIIHTSLRPLLPGEAVRCLNSELFVGSM